MYNVTFSHDFSEDTKFTFSAFGLDAQRNALGFRTNRVDQVDPGSERDLINGEFNNYGAEARFLSNYYLGEKKSIFLIGSKFYKADNTSKQGPGSDGSDPNFNFQSEQFPNYPNQNEFVFPNINCEDVHPEISALISQEKIVKHAIHTNLNIAAKASFGFGDVNGCVIFKKYN